MGGLVNSVAGGGGEEFMPDDMASTLGENDEERAGGETRNVAEDEAE